jgi:triosephosphate isomerase
VESQVRNGLENIVLKESKSLVLAYEPIWAIGTGKTASAEDAEKVISYMRWVLDEYFKE